MIVHLPSLDNQVLFCYKQFDELTLLHLREFDKKKLMSVETDIAVDHYKEEKFEESHSGRWLMGIISDQWGLPWPETIALCSGEENTFLCCQSAFDSEGCVWRVRKSFYQLLVERPRKGLLDPFGDGMTGKSTGSLLKMLLSSSHCS